MSGYARIDHNGVIIKDSRAQDQDQGSCAGSREANDTIINISINMIINTR